MKDFEDNVKNLYVIRHKLAALKKSPFQNYFEYWVGNKFRVLIYTREIQDLGHEDKDDTIIKHAKVDVNVYDIKKDGEFQQAHYIYLDKDDRFCNYQPIQYKEWGRACGRDMPINHLCELIKYLHIISKLSAFM